MENDPRIEPDPRILTKHILENRIEEAVNLVKYHDELVKEFPIYGPGETSESVRDLNFYQDGYWHGYANALDDILSGFADIKGHSSVKITRPIDQIEWLDRTWKQLRVINK